MRRTEKDVLGAWGLLSGVIGDSRRAAVSEGHGEKEERKRQADLIRCIFGNPLRAPPHVDPSWLTPAVFTLAHSVYTDRLLPSGHFTPDRLAALAQALEDAGCTDAELLAHLRSPGPHVRGCFALDGVLGKM